MEEKSVFDPNLLSQLEGRVPKIAESTTDSCCLALLSIATPSGAVQAPTSFDKWRTVQDAFIDAVEFCIIKGTGQGSGGMWFANSKPATPYSKAAMFQSGANAIFSEEARC